MPISLAVLLAIGCGDDGGHSPAPVPAPAECFSTAQLCLEDQCVPIGSCGGACVRESGVDDSGAEFRTACTLTRFGQTPDPPGSGLFDRIRLIETTECFTSERFQDTGFRRTGRCRVRMTETFSLLFCEGVVTPGQPCCPTQCFENSQPDRCRVVVTEPDGTTHTESCPTDTG